MMRRLVAATEREGSFPEQHAAGGSFDEGHHTVSVEGADHGIRFPVADLLAEFDRRGTFGDVTLARESAALLGTLVTFAPLRRLPQESIQLSTAFLVLADEPIDRLMTDLESTFEPKAAADLIR